MRAQQSNYVYKTALYLRLSKDDDNAGESSSITTQRSILQDYARQNGFNIADEYSDDGYSGTNYDRPEFKRMIADIESGRINCILTKDLSRLGRNSARTSDLLDEYFPSKRVRYISVTDGYDSFNLTSGTAMAAPFMTVMHEMYARDISNKIRTSFNVKMKSGDYIGNFAPYGYQKDYEHGDKNHLIIDPQVAHIVRRIFLMAAEGNAPGEIARYLNDRGVATPAVYRCLSRPYLNPDNYTRRREWTSSGVCKMLRNEVYLGKTLQGKTSKISFKSKVVQANPREDWIVVEGTHEPLISEETFRQVRSRSVARRNPPSKGFENVFSGIAKCAACGRNMTTAPSRKKGATYNLCCGGYKTYGAKECSNHFIDYDLLYNAVLQDLQKLVALTHEDKSSLAKELAQQAAASREWADDGAGRELAKMEQRVQEIFLLQKKLYEDLTFNRITATLYGQLSNDYAMELASLESSMAGLRQNTRPAVAPGEAYEQFFALLDEICEVKALSKPLLKKLVERIEVEQGEYVRDLQGKRQKQQRIRICYRFIGCINE